MSAESIFVDFDRGYKPLEITAHLSNVIPSLGARMPLGIQIPLGYECSARAAVLTCHTFLSAMFKTGVSISPPEQLSCVLPLSNPTGQTDLFGGWYADQGGNLNLAF